MKITQKDVIHVARLARLSLTDEEQQRYTGQMEAILSYIEHLNQLDTATVEPTSHAGAGTNVWREDTAKPSSPDTIERLLANAPEREDTFLKVPKIIE